MNSQFSMLYSVLFLSAIASSFIALRAGIDYWADYEIFLIDANEFMGSAELCSYFDDYSINLNFSHNLSVKINSSSIELSRQDFYKIFNNSAGIAGDEISSKDFILQKNSGGLRVI